MTFLAHRKANITADIHSISSITASSVSVGTTYSITGTPTHTTATISNGYIVLHNSSNWRIEAECVIQYYFNSASSTKKLELQFWDGSTYYGNRGMLEWGVNATVCRSTCSLFIPASSISTTLSLIPRVTALSGTDLLSFSGTPSNEIRILELPI